MRVLITGATGFISHHIVEQILLRTDWDIVGLHRDNTAGNMHKLTDLGCWEENKHRVDMIRSDLRSEVNDILASRIGQVDYILHLAALTHVDRSITNPMDAVYDNVVATGNLLEFARKYQKNLKLFNYFSTDEVYGTAPEDYDYKETDRHNPGNPYSATKSGGEMLCMSYVNTFKMPIFITNCMNIFGERQHHEKYIPLVIKKIINGDKLSIHSHPNKEKAGSRFYLHAANVADVILWLLNNAEVGESYNIVGEREIDNRELALIIESIVNRTHKDNNLNYEMVDFHSSRPGHDLRYALDGSKLISMGYKYPMNIEESLERTVTRYLNNKHRLGL